MPFALDWQVPQTVMRLTLTGTLTLHDYTEINTQVSKLLETVPVGVNAGLVVDATALVGTPTNVDQVTNSQKYAYLSNNPLKIILVVCSNKFMRLMMTLTFNLCRPYLYFVNSLDEVVPYLTRLKIISP